MGHEERDRLVRGTTGSHVRGTEGLDGGPGYVRCNEMVWGPWSADSSYSTTGSATTVAAAITTTAPGQGRKSRKKAAAAKKAGQNGSGAQAEQKGAAVVEEVEDDEEEEAGGDSEYERSVRVSFRICVCSVFVSGHGGNDVTSPLD